MAFKADGVIYTLQRTDDYILVKVNWDKIICHRYLTDHGVKYRTINILISNIKSNILQTVAIMTRGKASLFIMPPPALMKNADYSCFLAIY